MKRAVFLCVFLLSVFIAAHAVKGDDIDKEKAAIRTVVEESYLKGVHIERNTAAMRKGFHPEFSMLLFKDNNVTKWSIDHWIDVIETGRKKDPAPPRHEIQHEFSLIDVAGNAAVARVEIYRDGKHIFTDYLSLYKFREGWKIVGKIFYRYE